MNKLRISGILLIVGFLLFAVNSFLFPMPNLWQESDINIRMQIVEEYQSQFTNQQIVMVVGAVGLAAGYLLLTLHLKNDESARWANIGAVAILLANFSLAIMLLGGISDPRAYLGRNSAEGTALSIYSQGFNWLSITGYLLYGIVFLRGDFPKWLAYFTLGFTILILVATFFIGSFAVEFTLLIPLVVGIVLLRRSKEK